MPKFSHHIIFCKEITKLEGTKECTESHKNIMAHIMLDAGLYMSNFLEILDHSQFIESSLASFILLKLVARITLLCYLAVAV